MAYDFPASPTNGQIVTFGSTAWQWNGTAWLMQSGNVGPVGPTGPAGANGAQGIQGPAGPAGEVEEAPLDSQQYARQDATWVPFTVPEPAPQVGLVDVGDTPPASPLDRQQFWKSDDGTMWLRYNDGNGPPQWVQTNAVPTPASVITEQFFNLAGMSQLDIQVPAWAKGVQLIGHVFVSANAQMGLRASFDGTTFPAGATDYYWTGPMHNTGSTGYSAAVTTAATAMLMAPSGSEPSISHDWTAELALTRPNTSTIFGMKTWGMAFDPATTLYNRTLWWHAWPNTTLGGSALAIKALRFTTFTGVNVVEGWLKIKWIGDSNAIQTGTAIADAPSDGCEYTRVNGIWRKKSQTLILDGRDQNGAMVLVPPGAKLAKFTGEIAWGASSAALAPTLRVSLDGVNPLVGATDYTTSGTYFNNTLTTVTVLGGTNASAYYLGVTGSVANVGVKLDGYIKVGRTATNYFEGRVTSSVLTASAHYTALYQFWSSSAAYNGVLQLKGLQFGAHFNTGIFGLDSFVDLEWVY